MFMGDFFLVSQLVTTFFPQDTVENFVLAYLVLAILVTKQLDINIYKYICYFHSVMYNV